jgi:hypothetical protein
LARERMINYTGRLALLMQDIVSRVPALSFIDMADVLVFARPGRTSAEGAFATCHCLSLPPSEPGYYFWRDRHTSCITRRSEWFVTKSPVVTIGARQIKYMLSFTLPRFPDQSLDKSRKERWYPGLNNTWIAKLDTVVHELYHIDPEHNGIRRIDRGDGAYSAHCHSHQFFEQVAAMVTGYLRTRPDPAAYDFLQYDFAELEARHGGVVGTSFRTFPSYPHRFLEALPVQTACEVDTPGVEVQAIRKGQQPMNYTEEDLHIRQFMKETSRRLVRKGQFRAA